MIFPFKRRFQHPHLHIKRCVHRVAPSGGFRGASIEGGIDDSCTCNRQSTIPSTSLRTGNNRQSAAILIAEDNPANIQTFAGYLAPKGYRIIIAQNGKEAVEGTKKKHPDLILMDVDMPVMGGLEAIRHIRADEELKSIPIIALTALAMPGDREKCLAAGADEYISKPVSLHELSETIENLLR